MDNAQKEMQSTPEQKADNTPKWDYTTRGQTLAIGAGVVGLNVLVIIVVILDRTIPAVHALITGKPI